MPQRGRWLLLGALAAVVVGLFWWKPSAGGAPTSAPAARPTTVSAGEVTVSDLVERGTYPGELDADAADVAATVAGRVVAVHVRIGDRVDKGKELARVDAAEWVRERARTVAQEKAAAAAMQRAAVQIEAARREVERARALREEGLMSQQQLDAARDRLDVLEAEARSADAQQAEARAGVGVLDQKLADTSVRAPFAGRIAARHVDPGDFLQVGAPLVRLVAEAPLRVRFEVPEQDIGPIAVGARLAIRAPVTGAREVAGHVTGVGTEVDRQRRIIHVEGIVDEPPASWLPGMFAEVVTVKRTLDDARIIPAAALVSRLQRSGKVEEGVLRPDQGRARWVAVRVLARDGDRVAVEGALEAGMQVLVGGHTDLAEGAPIVVAGGAEP